MRTDSFLFADDGDIPNHPRWPMIVYARVVDPAASEPAVAFERLFESHGWGDGWRNGIFPFPHYHSNAHEALGIAAGQAKVRFGGGAGTIIEVAAGDAVLLPAGTGHQLLASSPDLLVIGAYPPGPRRDLMRAGEANGQAIRSRVSTVAKPATDPFAGTQGPMRVLWQ
ncbi:MAG: cupin [Pseudomonadota bacterium]|nr:cupin [Pseudomonadota bacterium]